MRLGGAIPLSDLLKAMGDSPERKPDALPPNLDIKARVLIDALPSFHAPCPFKVGDLVVPATGSGSAWRQSLGVCIVSRLLPPGTVLPADPEMANGAYHKAVDMVLLGEPGTSGLHEIKAASRDFIAYTGSVA